MLKISKEAEELFHKLQNLELLYKPSLEECQITIETREINKKLLHIGGLWGEFALLISGSGKTLPTHAPTKETMVLLEKIQELWKLAKESLVPYNRRHLQVVKPCKSQEKSEAQPSGG